MPKYKCSNEGGNDCGFELRPHTIVMCDTMSEAIKKICSECPIEGSILRDSDCIPAYVGLDDDGQLSLFQEESP